MPSPGSVRATVLIPTVADSKRLRQVLEIVRWQANAERAEILLVFNRVRARVSAESLVELSVLCDRIEFEARSGKSAALNRGVDFARGEVIAMTDDDTIPQPDWLAAICRPLLRADRDPRLVAVGGPVIPIFEPATPEWFERLVMSRSTHFIGPRHDLGDEPLEYPMDRSGVGVVPIGANFAVRREAFEALRYTTRLGPSAATGLRGGEDTAFGLQLLRANKRIVYEPTARVHHPVRLERTRFAFVRDAYYQHGRESIVLRRHLGLELPSLSRQIRKAAKHWLKRRSAVEGDAHEEMFRELRRIERLGRFRESLWPSV